MEIIEVSEIHDGVAGKINLAKFVVTAILLTLASAARAELYMEFGFQGGGDTLISTNSGEGIYTGGGLKFAIGVQNKVGKNGATLSLSLGNLSDEIDTSNGTAEISTLNLDAIYSYRIFNHRFGFGASYHIDPTYSNNIVGLPPFKIEFDDALGLILQYSYVRISRFQISTRYTLMDYEASGLSLDASSFGIFLSNGF